MLLEGLIWANCRIGGATMPLLQNLKTKLQPKSMAKSMKKYHQFVTVGVDTDLYPF
jgi:hypothetical protein